MPFRLASTDINHIKYYHGDIINISRLISSDFGPQKTL